MCWEDMLCFGIAHEEIHMKMSLRWAENKVTLNAKRYVHGEEMLKLLYVETSEQCGVPGIGLQMPVRRIPDSIGASNEDLVDDEWPIPLR